MEYWNSTKDLTRSGRPADAFIMPVAPFPAARPEKFNYYGYTTICNLLDYTSCTVPVTCADKGIDVVQKDFNPLSNLDREIMDTCNSPSLWVGAWLTSLNRRSRNIRRRACRCSDCRPKIARREDTRACGSYWRSAQGQSPSSPVRYRANHKAPEAVAWVFCRSSLLEREESGVRIS